MDNEYIVQVFDGEVNLLFTHLVRAVSITEALNCAGEYSKQINEVKEPKVFNDLRGNGHFGDADEKYESD